MCRPVQYSKSYVISPILWHGELSHIFSWYLAGVISTTLRISTGGIHLDNIWGTAKMLMIELHYDTIQKFAEKIHQQP